MPKTPWNRLWPWMSLPMKDCRWRVHDSPVGARHGEGCALRCDERAEGGTRRVGQTAALAPRPGQPGSRFSYCDFGEIDFPELEKYRILFEDVSRNLVCVCALP